MNQTSQTDVSRFRLQNEEGKAQDHKDPPNWIAAIARGDGHADEREEQEDNRLRYRADVRRSGSKSHGDRHRTDQRRNHERGPRQSSSNPGPHISS